MFGSSPRNPFPVNPSSATPMTPRPTLPLSLARRLLCWTAAGVLLAGLACPGHRRDQTSQEPADTTAPLKGRLTDHGTALALPGAEVFLQDSRRPRIYRQTFTQADGSYTFSRPPAGVPLRVVAQPSVGSLTYGVEVSPPFTLSRDAPNPTVDLACTPAPRPGNVEGSLRPQSGSWRVALVQKRDVGGAPPFRAVVRMVRAEADGSFRFTALPPGSYEVHGLPGGPPRPPGPRRRPGSRPGRRRAYPPVDVLVTAGATAHVAWPRRAMAAPEAEDAAAEDPDAVEGVDEGEETGMP